MILNLLFINNYSSCERQAMHPDQSQTTFLHYLCDLLCGNMDLLRADKNIIFY
jgi:hypothetical protein